MAPVKSEVEKQRLFKAMNQFAYLEYDESRLQGDYVYVCEPVVGWSGSGVFGDGPDTRFIIATTPEEAKIKMKYFVLSHPEGFGFLGKYVRKYTQKELVEHFQKAFDQEVDEKNPKLGQHRIKIEEVENVIF